MVVNCNSFLYNIKIIGLLPIPGPVFSTTASKLQPPLLPPHPLLGLVGAMLDTLAVMGIVVVVVVVVLVLVWWWWW